jgi:hypothetical protein
MTRFTLRSLVLVSLLAGSALALATPPATLGYQGNLANSAGQPITDDLTLTFRLYDVPSGGSALWTEVQNGVAVDGGNLSVELGGVTPLPSGIWGRQLYLGVQIAGDSEMQPRPPLTAAPYALRAASTMKRTLTVSAEGTATDNGAALLAVVASITDASLDSPVVVALDAGTYDLGAASLAMPSHTVLAGQGQSATLITSTHAPAGSGATVQLASHTAARDFTARNTGVSAGESDSTQGLAASDPDQFQVPVTNVTLERVTGESIAPPATLLGQRAGISFCASNSRATDITARAFGSLFASALRAECPSINLKIDGATIDAADARDGVRGAWLVAGAGNEWKRLSIRLDVAPSNQTAFGIRVLSPGSFTSELQGRLSDSTITLRGGGLLTPTTTSRVEGIELNESAQLALIEHVNIAINNLRAANVRGIGLRETANNVGATVELRDVDIRIAALQEAAFNFGEIVGIRAEGYPPQLRRVRVNVDCVSGGFNPCIGIAQPENWSTLPGTLLLVDSDVQVGHRAPADGSTRSAALQVMGPTQVQGSRLRAVQSATGEPVRAIRHLASSAVTRVTHSQLISTDFNDSNTGCLFDGPAGANGEWFGNHVQGSRCDGGQVNLICAGNTQRGVGLLTNACP